MLQHDSLCNKMQQFSIQRLINICASIGSLAKNIASFTRLRKIRKRKKLAAGKQQNLPQIIIEWIVRVPLTQVIHHYNWCHRVVKRFLSISSVFCWQFLLARWLGKGEWIFTANAYYNLWNLWNFKLFLGSQELDTDLFFWLRSSHMCTATLIYLNMWCEWKNK